MAEIIVALDVATKEQALAIVKKFNPKHCKLKVGLELFASAGLDFVDVLQNMGFDVFLDLKLHDIPNTLTRVASILKLYDIWMVTVNAGCGKPSLDAIAEALYNTRTKVIGVTTLTSLECQHMNDIGIHDSITAHATILARSCMGSGLDGIVCSGRELNHMHSLCQNKMTLVVPGIRTSEDNRYDQKRTITPAQAKVLGADYLVIGRPIIEADFPNKALKTIRKYLK